MVEIIPKKISKSPCWLSILFYLSIFFLLITIVGFFLLRSSIDKGEEQLASIEAAFYNIRNEENLELEKKVLKGSDKIRNFSILSSAHLKPSSIFPLIEKVTHPLVWFSSFNFSTKDGALSLGGQAENFEVLGQEVIILREEESIKNVDLKNISTDKEGKISFTVSFSLNSESENE